MKLGLLVWATGALAGPCKPGYNVPGSLSTGSSPDSTSRVHDEPDQTDTFSGALSTGSVPFVSLPPTSSDTDETETGTETAGVPVPDNTQSGVISSQTGVPITDIHQPGNTQTTVVGTETDGPAVSNTAVTESLGTGAETRGQETQPIGTQTGDIPQNGPSASVPSDSQSVDVPGTVGDETPVAAPTGSQTAGVPGTDGDQTSSGTLPGTQTGGVPGTATGETSSINEPSGPQSQGTESSPADTVEVTGTSPVDNPDVTTFPGEDATQTGTISSEVPSGEVSEPGPVFQTGSDATMTGGPNPGNTETGSPTDTDLTGGSIPTGSETGSPVDNTSTGTGPVNTQTGPATEATGVETGFNTQTVPGASESSEGSQPEPTFDTTLPGESQPTESQSLTGNPEDGTSIATGPSNTETGVPGNSEPVESQSASGPSAVDSSTGSEPANTEPVPATETTLPVNSKPVESQPSDSDAETETTAAELPQLTESVSSNIPSVPAGETITKPDAGVTDSLPVSTGASDLPVITEAPGVTSVQPPPAPTATVTEVPADWAPTCVSGHTEWTANTWITTTAGGSSTPTEVPVLIDTKECDGDGAGLILWGFPHVSGTQFNLPGAPPFSLPCLPPLCSTPPTTGPGNGEDSDDDSSKSDKSTATCTDASTVSNCLVECTTQVGVETPECTTTCSMTATGCSVTGTTTTTEVDACSATGDASGNCDVCPADFTPENSDPEASDDDFDSESESGLARRWNGPDQNRELRVGHCDAEVFGTSFKFPNYPSGPNVFDNEDELGNSPLNAVTRWVWKEVDKNTCRPQAKGPENTVDSRRKVRPPTIDHVFEKSFLRDYWREITRNGGNGIYGTKPSQKQKRINCADLKEYGGISMSLVKDVFMKYPGATQNPGNVVQPSESNFLEDFMGMDAWTNRAKGIVTSPDQITRLNSQIKTYNANSLINPIMAIIAERMDLVYQVVVGVQIVNMASSKEIMIRQNTRIYQALQVMDQSAKKDCKEKAVASGMWSFAERYKDLMTSRFEGTERFSINPRLANSWRVLQTQIEADFRAADERITAMVETTPKDKTVKSNWRNKYNAHYKVWYSYATKVKQIGVPKIISPEWVWPEPKPLAKRADDNELGFCNVELPTTSGPPTTFSTLVSTSSADEQTTDSAPEPTSTAILCESDDDCGSMECKDDERSFCSSRLGQMPGMPKFCSCVAKPITTPPPTTTSAEEAKPTTSTIDEGECKTDEDCKTHQCNAGYHPVCGTGDPMNPSPPFCHCEGAPPTSTKPAPPQDTHDPNDDFPEVECSVHADCDKWQGVCPRGNKYCSATDWEIVNGVLTSKRAICSC
ncbi:hypothetical protein NW768_007504 [Fusarium equiseti]|uniref:Uncharacterized protein n=1 Tax=Fusarium equiseti TaxID=61235 RepID=A0ABQ8R817_FUSEQ|nr:hypothetical protein NW768_007504 [Fusarium equiseti]